MYSKQYGALLCQESEWKSLLVAFVLHRLRRPLALGFQETQMISRQLAFLSGVAFSRRGFEQDPS